MKSISFLKRITIPKEWPQLKVWRGLDTILHFNPLLTREYIRGISAKLYLFINLLKITNQIAPIPFHGKTAIQMEFQKSHNSFLVKIRLIYKGTTKYITQSC